MIASASRRLGLCYRACQGNTRLVYEVNAGCHADYPLVPKMSGPTYDEGETQSGPVVMRWTLHRFVLALCACIMIIGALFPPASAHYYDRACVCQY